MADGRWPMADGRWSIADYDRSFRMPLTARNPCEKRFDELSVGQGSECESGVAEQCRRTLHAAECPGQAFVRLLRRPTERSERRARLNLAVGRQGRSMTVVDDLQQSAIVRRRTWPVPLIDVAGQAHPFRL